MSVFITGGAGYVGSRLVPLLLDRGEHVIVYDKMYFGSKSLPDHPQLTVIEGDIRDIELLKQSLSGADAVIHLACIANDPSFELDPKLSKSINFDCFEPMVHAAKGAGVKRFIYASSSSVYGVSEEPSVTEEHPLLPITDYNKFKGMAEPILLNQQSEEFTTVVVRPATVCGYSPRMRLDLTVNILTNWAYHKQSIRVFGGAQQRPNIHIQDICDLYLLLLNLPSEKIAGEIFNAGYQNYTVSEIAAIVRRVILEECPHIKELPIETTASDDIRSYHICSDKLANKLNFVPRYTLEDAVREVCKAFKEGLLPDSFENPLYFNVQQMKLLFRSAAA